MMVARVPYSRRFSPDWYEPEKNILRIEQVLRRALPGL